VTTWRAWMRPEAIFCPATMMTPVASADIQQVLARYVRDTDHRDGADLSKLFTPGRVR
jgi:hypothetical protein